MSCFMREDIHSVSVLGTAFTKATRNISKVEKLTRDMTMKQKIDYAEGLFIKLARENGEFCSDQQLQKI